MTRGHRPTPGTVSGSDPNLGPGGEAPSAVPVVHLHGAAMAPLAHAIVATEAITDRPITVVGGLAVICRLNRPYRATSDLDTVHRRRPGDRPQLEILMAAGATPSGVAGALVPTPAGDVQVDVLEVTDADLNRLPSDPTDRLHVLAHAWAAATATTVVLRHDSTGDLPIAVAEPGALIATKLQSAMNRGLSKEATDLLDIVQLTLDRDSGPRARTALANADLRLREEAARHARLWFDDRLQRTTRLVRGVPEGADLTTDDIALVGELLLSSLDD